MRNKQIRLNIILMVIFGSLMLLLMTSCVNKVRGTKAPQSKRLELDSTSQYYDQTYRVYTLEGCEYVVSGVGSNRWGSHKGNCKNQIHDEKK